MDQLRNRPKGRLRQTLPAVSALLVLGLFGAPSLHAEDVRESGSRAEQTLVVELEIEAPDEAPRRYRLVTTTLGNDAELSVGRSVPFEVGRSVGPSDLTQVSQVQYQDVGLTFRAQVRRLEDGRLLLRGRIEDQSLGEIGPDGRPLLDRVSQSVQAILQPGVPIEVGSAEDRVHRLTLRLPAGRGVGTG